MIRHILFWNYTDEIKEKKLEDEFLVKMQASVNNMVKNTDGLIYAEIDKNIAPDSDLIFYSEFEDEAALGAFQNNPYHVAHKNNFKNVVTGRICGDIKTNKE